MITSYLCAAPCSAAVCPVGKLNRIENRMMRESICLLVIHSLRKECLLISVELVLDSFDFHMVLKCRSDIRISVASYDPPPLPTPRGTGRPGHRTTALKRR